MLQRSFEQSYVTQWELVFIKTVLGCGRHCHRSKQEGKKDFSHLFLKFCFSINDIQAIRQTVPVALLPYLDTLKVEYGISKP